MGKKGLDRRDFLKIASMGLAGGYFTLKSGAALAGRMGGGGGGMGGGGGGGGMGGGVIDPPPGALFADPVMMPVERANGTVTVNLEAAISQINVNGSPANLMTYGWRTNDGIFHGYYPGPTILVKSGDLMKVNFTNNLPYTTQTNLLGYQKNLTNLHTHGWHVSPEPPADYVMYHIGAGETYNHVYDLAKQRAGSFNFYHPHKHGVSAEQYWAGLAGALITEDEPGHVLSNYETHLMVLKDISLSGSDPAPHSMMSDFMHGKEGNTIMVNGQVNPVLNIKKGQVQRWRILNASSARWYKLSFDPASPAGTMYLVGTDGQVLDYPRQLSQILLSPGERVEVLVKATASAGRTYKFLSLPYSRMGNMTSAQITLLTLNINGSVSPAQNLPTAIAGFTPRLDPNTLPIMARQTLALSMGQGNGYINGQDFDVEPYEIMSTVGTYEIWTVTNQSGMDHPFHQHVNPSLILSIKGADPSYPRYDLMPAWKDTVLIPKWGSVTMLVPVMDYSGMAMFHCHILEHEDIGMMGMWHLMGGMGGM